MRGQVPGWVGLGSINEKEQKGLHRRVEQGDSYRRYFGVRGLYLGSSLQHEMATALGCRDSA